MLWSFFFLFTFYWKEKQIVKSITSKITDSYPCIIFQKRHAVEGYLLSFLVIFIQFIAYLYLLLHYNFEIRNVKKKNLNQ